MIFLHLSFFSVTFLLFKEKPAKMLKNLFKFTLPGVLSFWKVSNLDIEESPLVTFFPKSVCYSR